MLSTKLNLTSEDILFFNSHGFLALRSYFRDTRERVSLVAETVEVIAAERLVLKPPMATAAA